MDRSIVHGVRPFIWKDANDHTNVASSPPGALFGEHLGVTLLPCEFGGHSRTDRQCEVFCSSPARLRKLEKKRRSACISVRNPTINGTLSMQLGVWKRKP